jgi:hypothetical protein
VAEVDAGALVDVSAALGVVDRRDLVGAATGRG